MTPLQEAENLLPELSRAEKAQLLPSLISEIGEAFPGIERQPGVCGGEPCIVRTRIPVRLLEQARRSGTPEAELLQCYPTLRAEYIVHAWAYVRAHRAEIERQIQDNDVSAFNGLLRRPEASGDACRRASALPIIAGRVEGRRAERGFRRRLIALRWSLR